jgi:hypothetical protein
MELAKASAELSSYYEPAVEDDRRMRNPLYAATECAEDQLLKAPVVHINSNQLLPDSVAFLVLVRKKHFSLTLH